MCFYSFFIPGGEAMKEKECADACQCDDQSAAALAAGSMAKFFKDQNWKIISFFPNTPCAKKPKRPVRRKKNTKNDGKAS